MKVLSLGWGVQSFTLAVMAALGDVDHLDAALHADTLHEQTATYQFAARWTPWLEERGVKVATVKNPTGGFWEVTRRPGQTHVPAFTRGVDGNAGMLNRSCTHRWKIVPIRRWLQANRNGEPVEQWIGISTDEALRMKPSDVKYVTHRWPLIEKGMSRQDCERYLSKHGIEIPPRSACVFCPFHDTAEWRKIKDDSKDWGEAVAVDEHLRKLRPPYDLFVHPSRKALASVDLRTAEQKGQYRLWDDECSGICGV